MASYGVLFSTGILAIAGWGYFTAALNGEVSEWIGSPIDAQGGCEKIPKTPLPFVYVVRIKQLILVYLLTLPIAGHRRADIAASYRNQVTIYDATPLPEKQ